MRRLLQRVHLSLVLLALLTPLPLGAHVLVVGKPLPHVMVADRGELIYQNNQFSYKFWDSSRLKGKIYLIQHIAARTSATEMNAGLIASIKKASLPRKYYQTITIVNQNDALFGSGQLARNWLENNKKMAVESQFILDIDGSVRKAWRLQPKESAIVVLDAHGRIRYSKEGALTLKEIEDVIHLLHRLVPGGAA